MKIKKSYLWALIVVLLVIGGGYYWYRKSQSSNNQTQYVTTTVQKGTLISAISASGNIIVDQSATVEPTITGTVANLSVQIGDNVQQGQHLFDVVNDDLSVSVDKSEASLGQSKTSLESAEANKKQADADLSSAKHKNKVTPGSYTKRQIAALQEKLDAADKSVDSSEQSLQASQADLANQQDTASKRQVTAPISGTVNAINIKNGDNLSNLSSGSSGHVSPIIIGDLGTLKAQVQVNEVDVPNVSAGQKVTMTFDAIPNFTATGKVEKIDSLGTLSQNVVTYNVTIGFDTLDNRIKPEMSVSASIVTSVNQNVITVPNGAIKTQGNTSYVEVLKGQTPQQVSVQTGATNDTDTEITSGLNVGDQVITQTISPNSNANTNTNSRTSSGAGGAFRFGGGGIGGGGPRGD